MIHFTVLRPTLMKTAFFNMLFGIFLMIHFFVDFEIFCLSPIRDFQFWAFSCYDVTMFEGSSIPMSGIHVTLVLS